VELSQRAPEVPGAGVNLERRLGGTCISGSCSGRPPVQRNWVEKVQGLMKSWSLKRIETVHQSRHVSADKAWSGASVL
jgi:hypothetical protein